MVLYVRTCVSVQRRTPNRSIFKVDLLTGFRVLTKISRKSLNMVIFEARLIAVEECISFLTTSLDIDNNHSLGPHQLQHLAKFN